MTTAIAEITETSSSRTVDTARGSIHLNEAGEGPAIVLLHGSGPGATGWANFAPNLGALARRHRVIAPDMPGWGTSTTDDSTTRDHALDLEALLDAVGIEQAALVGNSMGGTTAIRFAIAHPERTTHVITMGAPAPGTNLQSPGGGLSEGMKVLIGTYQEPTAANFKRLVEVMCFDPAFATDELARRRADAVAANPDNVASFLAGLSVINIGGSFLDYLALGPELGGIAAPVLAIHGRDDRVVHWENSARIAASVPDGRMLLLNRCGHWAQIEHAAEFNRVVDSFVSG